MNHSQTVVSFLTNSLHTTASFWVPYLAVPYKKFGRDLSGWDCFGAIRFILNKHAGLELPLFDSLSAAEILRQSQKPVWKIVNEPKAFDVVCMDLPNIKGRRPMHVGVMVNKERVFHCDEGIGSVCVPLNHFSIRDRVRIIYRHERLA